MASSRLRTLLVLAIAATLASVGPRIAAQVRPEDSGAAGAWQKLRKLGTTASVMHTTAHPDDEHGGLLTWLSRGAGARVSLLTLTRGEAGDNAIGPELFDALGLIRTEELGVAGRYYGLDAQYFTTAADYGFSKRLDEALDMWGRDDLVRDVVRAIRLERPLIVVSRFQGGSRDGHGQHQAAGVATREAFEAAGDPARFPEQIEEGLRPWRPLRLYVGGMRENEDWDVRVDVGRYSPVLGESYQMFAWRGLSFQRSQNGGRRRLGAGSSYRYYDRVDLEPTAEDRVDDLFAGIDTSLTGFASLVSETISPDVENSIRAVDRLVADAVSAFDFQRPSASVPALLRALEAARRNQASLDGHPELGLVMSRKVEQMLDAVNACLGIELRATAVQADAQAPSGPAAAFAPPMTLGPIVPGQRFAVEVQLINRGPESIDWIETALAAPAGWQIDGAERTPRRLGDNDSGVEQLDVTVPADADVTRPYFTRASIAQSRYELLDVASRQRPFRLPVLNTRATYRIDDVTLEISSPVGRWESHVPYGFERRELTVVPALSLTMTPRQAVVPIGSDRELHVRVELLNSDPDGAQGDVALSLPAGWTSDPARHAYAFSAAGQRRVFDWTVDPAPMTAGEYELEAVARSGGREYREGFEAIAHRDLETRLLYRPAVTRVRGLELEVAPDLAIGYVMGIGDDVPSGIRQLGATVELLDDEQLASIDLQRFDAIVTGTRAYAVRPSLKTRGRRLLEYVEGGGHLIVLYNTDELVPSTDAPYPAELPRRSEEVSEEDSPVERLDPDHPLMRWPNLIAPADFDGWVEQRGSKFWSEWDPRYTPLLSTHDVGQAPQRGGWLTTRFGAGHYTYFAYALHRQLPYGVPGAYRLLANLLSLGRAAEQ